MTGCGSKAGRNCPAFWIIYCTLGKCSWLLRKTGRAHCVPGFIAEYLFRQVLKIQGTRRQQLVFWAMQARHCWKCNALCPVADTHCECWKIKTGSVRNRVSANFCIQALWVMSGSSILRPRHWKQGGGRTWVTLNTPSSQAWRAVPDGDGSNPT